MRVYPFVLAVALVIGLLTGDRRLRTERAPFRHGWAFIAAAVLEVLPFTPLLRPFGFASGLSRLSAIAGFGVLLSALCLNIRTPGVALIATGVALNLAVMVANMGRMPTEPAAAARAGVAGYVDRLDEPGVHRHVQADASTPLRFLDDRFPVPPLRQVISAGDVVLAIGAAWWLLALLGSRLVRPRLDLAAKAAIRKGGCQSQS